MARIEPTVVKRTPHGLSFDITGTSLELALAIPLKTRVFGHRKVEGWSVDKYGKRMVLYWAISDGASREGQVHPLPAPMELDQVVGFVESWLGTVNYGEAPDTDGSTEKGSRVYCEQWGRIEGHGWGAFVAIEPEWLIYGK